MSSTTSTNNIGNGPACHTPSRTNRFQRGQAADGRLSTKDLDAIPSPVGRTMRLVWPDPDDPRNGMVVPDLPFYPANNPLKGTKALSKTALIDPPHNAEIGDEGGFTKSRCDSETPVRLPPTKFLKNEGDFSISVGCTIPAWVRRAKEGSDDECDDFSDSDDGNNADDESELCWEYHCPRRFIRSDCEHWIVTEARIWRSETASSKTDGESGGLFMEDIGEHDDNVAPSHGMPVDTVRIVEDNIKSSSFM
ncbi:hypothetical protein FISHEDRAFT_56128 [Fistulina hepatica ATCC 64428]|uniref:Uncharacterized protein n=1 Tax=Fistulina hepatica ATCC 64428 TaxID=1128425 RepID=A0A0D7ALG4_9AGAR|nr:hypothetical protein FISHEDRAFT_56128 [Fistulina hepatica ATCC 64428]